MYGSDLYRRLARRDRDRSVVARGRLAPAGLVAGPRFEELAPPGRLGQDVRPAARADHRRGGAGPVPADVDRRRPRRASGCRPTAGSIRPAWPRRWPPAPASAARRSAPHTRVVAIGVEPRPRGDAAGRAYRRAPRRTRARSGPTSWSTPAGMFAPEIGRMVGVTVPIIPMAHQYLFTEPIDGVHPGLPQLRDPDNLVYFREEVGGLCMGGYERDPAPWSLDGVPADFNGKLLAPDMAALRGDHGRRHPAGPGDRRRRGQPGDQRPRGVHPGQRVHPRRERGPRLLRGRRVLRARHRRRRRDRPPDGDLDRRRRARARPLEDGHPAVRAGLSDRRPTRWRARSRTTRPTTTSTTRTRSARPAGRCGRRRPTRRWPASARRSARSPAGSGRTGSSRTPMIRARRPDLEALRPRGWAGQHWSPAIGAEALATRPAAGLFDETSFAKIEVVGPGALRVPPARLRATTSTAPVGHDRLHPAARPPRRDPVRPDRDPAGSATASCSSPARPSATTTWAGCARHLPDDGIVDVHDITAGRVCFGLWGPRARDILAPASRATTSPTRPSRTSPRARSRVGSVPVYALRVTYVGELGWELYAPTEYGRALWETLWDGRPAARPGRRRLPGDRRAPAREGLPGLVERHHPRRDAVRGWTRVRRRARQGRPDFMARDALRGGQGGRPAQAPALPRPRRPALRLPRQRAGPGRRGGRRPGHLAAATGSRSNARSPMPTCRPTRRIGTRGEVEVFGRVGRLRGRPRAAVRPEERADPVVTGDSGSRWTSRPAPAPSGALASGARRMPSSMPGSRCPRRLRRCRRDRPCGIPARPR